MSKKLKITLEEYESGNEEGAGMCVYCGELAYGVEPDARKYTCEDCGLPGVYGLEELLISGKLEVE